MRTRSRSRTHYARSGTPDRARRIGRPQSSDPEPDFQDPGSNGPNRSIRILEIGQPLDFDRGTPFSHKKCENPIFDGNCRGLFSKSEKSAISRKTVFHVPCMAKRGFGTFPACFGWKPTSGARFGRFPEGNPLRTVRNRAKPTFTPSGRQLGRFFKNRRPVPRTPACFSRLD